MEPKRPHLFRMTAADGFLLALLLIVSAASFAGTRFFLQEEGSEARILVDGRLTYAVDLDRSRHIDLGTVQVEVEGGRIRISDAECPRQICKHTGWISGTAETIICIPNRILIEITGPETDDHYNAVSY